jgi:hypothetical protein
MPTVRNLGDPTGAVDKPLTSANRSNAGNPNGSLTPQFSGEIIHDTTNQVLWQAQGLTNALWTLYSPGTQDVVA